MKHQTQKSLLDRFQQIKKEVVSTGMVGTQKFNVTRADLLGPTAMQASDELLDITQVAARLGIPKSTVYELTRSRAHIKHEHPLPAFKVGRRLKFNWTAVISWLDTLEKEGIR
jgi:excisionase family DNA binding protein